MTDALSPAEFAAAGHEMIDWIARYLREIEQYPVLSRVTPGEVRSHLPASPPAAPATWPEIFADFEQHVLPGVTHWNHPGFFAYFAITGSAPGILAELLTAALNVNAMLWRTGPAATELEQLALDWLRQLVGLSPGWFGITTDTASISSMLALAAARERRGDLEIRQRGIAGRADVPVMRVYCSEHAHSSIDKAAIALGLGANNVVHIGSDAEYRMRADALSDAIAADRAGGMLPLAVVATVGTTSTTSIDPVPAIAEVCRRHDVWLHVDGAYGGVAAMVPELRHIMAGVDQADSLVMNPHKWLFTPVDCSAFYTRHPDVLKRAFALVPDYLVTPIGDEAVDFMNYGVQLGHRFRALKLWAVMRSFGSDALASVLRQHCALATKFAGWVQAEAHWQVVAPVPLSVVCFCYSPPGVSPEAADALNMAILDRVNRTGLAYLSHTKLGGRVILRLAIGNVRTGEGHVAQAWELLQNAATNEPLPSLG
ncbi:MAG TPA: pyridoxal-dependent decarboxylase [Gemmatimonadaceae bacterium]|nr:pyridoxal-dependent decarboxylase [Gemmatimonadaceae bacterium]